MANKNNTINTFLISWTDMVTLLLVFFIYIVSISEVNVMKLMESKKTIIKYLGASTSVDTLDNFQIRHQQVRELYQELQGVISQQQLESQVSVAQKNDEIHLHLATESLFDSGKAHLKPTSKTALSKISGLFKEVKGVIIIEGHTDDIPINTEEFPSNWELSAARAASVAHFVADTGVPQDRLVISGYSQYKPLVPNTSDENRAKNRRISVIYKPYNNPVVEGELP